MNYCRSCRRDFGSRTAFDAHRVGRHSYTHSEGLRFVPPVEDGRRCLYEHEMRAAGMTVDKAGCWRTEARPEPLILRITAGRPLATSRRAA